MTLCSLYEQAEFLLGGGIFEILVKVLGDRVGRLAVLQPNGEDLSLVDATGISSERTTLHGGIGHVDRLLADRSDQGVTILEIDEVMDSDLEEEWSHVVLLGGSPWVIALLLPCSPDGELRRLLTGADGLVRIWNRHHSIEGMERNMASLSYLLYAVKSALPSIFEPFPPDFLATFLVDIMRESFCPERITLFQDDGEKLRLLAGDYCKIPERGGIFSKDYLSPVPVPMSESHRSAVGSENLDLLGDLYSVVLPVISGTDRFFFLIKWGNLRSGEVSDVLELIGGVTAKAMAMSRLKDEGTTQVKELSKREFALRGLHRAILSLMENDKEDDLLVQVLDIFGEMTQSGRCFAVVYDKSAPGYVKWGERIDGVVKTSRRLVLSIDEPLDIEGLPGVFSMDQAAMFFRDRRLDFEEVLSSCGDIENIFPLRYGKTFMGFVAVSSSVTGSRYGDMDGLETLAASSAVAIRRCRLFEEVSMQRDLLDRQVRARDFLRELAGEIQQIRSIDILGDILAKALPLALDVKKAELVVGIDGLTEISDRARSRDVLIVRNGAIWVPLRSGGSLHGALKLVMDEPESVGDDRLELMSLIGALLAPRLEAMRRCYGDKFIDLGTIMSGTIRDSLDELLIDGFDPSVIQGPSALSKDQERCCFRTVKDGEKLVVVLPFPWEGEVKQLFPPSSGWNLFG